MTMRLLKRFFLCALLGTWLGLPAHAQNKVGTTAAAFLGIGTDARATAMGGAHVALADGPSAAYWNPAGLALMASHGVHFSSAQWFVDSEFQNVAVGLKVAGGTLGLNLVLLSYGEMEVTTITSPEGTGELFTPRDLSFGVSYARSLTDRFTVGATAKVVRQTIWNESATGAALDLGVFYQTGFRNLRIGMTMANFGTDMSMEGKDLRRAIDIDEDIEGNNPRLGAALEVDAWPMPLLFRVGLAMDAFTSNLQRLTMSVDAQHPNDGAESANAGLEYAFRETLFIRGGYRQAFTEISEDGGWTVGFGLRYSANNRLGAYFDYVYQEYGRLGNPQMWTLGVTF